jgi:hypothetical protein
LLLLSLLPLLLSLFLLLMTIMMVVGCWFRWSSHSARVVR